MKTVEMSRKRMIVVARPRIDSLKLIEEIKKRPCLYTTKAGAAGTLNHEMKNAAWGEIGAAIFSDVWDQASITTKDNYVKELQVKWRSLRDNFTRQLRIQDEVKAGLKTQLPKKYIFMDVLSFLLPYVSKREKYMNTTNTSEDEASITDTIDSVMYFSDAKPEVPSQEEEIEVAEVKPPPIISNMPQIQFIPIKPRPPMSEASFISGGIDLNSLTSASPIKFATTTEQDKPSLKRMASCMEDMVKMQKEEKTDDPMGNKKFLMSLLPFMKKLPDDVNLEVRLQLVSVLETYVRAINNK